MRPGISPQLAWLASADNLSSHPLTSPLAPTKAGRLHKDSHVQAQRSAAQRTNRCEPLRALRPPLAPPGRPSTEHGMLAQLTRLRSDHQISDVALQGDGFLAKPARKVAARGLRLEKAALAVSTRGAGFLSISAQPAKLCLLRGPPYPTFSFQKQGSRELSGDSQRPALCRN